MSKESKPKEKAKADRWNLGEALKTDLEDFCEANFQSSESEVIRRAVRAFIDGHLGTDEKMKARFDEARKARRGNNGKLTVINGAKD